MQKQQLVKTQIKQREL
jgi:hypothetical protein